MKADNFQIVFAGIQDTYIKCIPCDNLCPPIRYEIRAPRCNRCKRLLPEKLIDRAHKIDKLIGDFFYGGISVWR